MAKKVRGDGVPPEAQRKDVRFEMRFEADMMERLDRLAKRRGVSIGSLLRWAASQLLESIDPQPPPSKE